MANEETDCSTHDVQIARNQGATKRCRVEYALRHCSLFHKNPGKLLVFPATKNSVICHRKKIVCRLLILSKSRSLIDTTVNKQKPLQ